MIRLGFIGAGGYAKIHREGFLQLEQENLIQIVALADSSPEVLAQASQEHKRAVLFQDYRELLEYPALDAVVISAPIGWHEGMALDALARGLYVLLEKPPVPLLSQLTRLSEADTAGRVMIGFQHVYSEGVRLIKDHILSGRLGELRRLSTSGVWPRPAEYYARASWSGRLVLRDQVILDGPCTNACAHFLNNLFFLAGDTAESYATPASLRAELYRARPVESYDTGCLRGRMSTGVPFYAGFSHAGSPQACISTLVEGDRGSIRIERDGNIVVLPGGEEIAVDDGRDNMRRAFLRLCRGDSSGNLTTLSAMRPYVLATNLMFESSAGVHEIAPDWYRIINPGAPSELYAIEGIQTYLAEGARTQALFSEQSVPWAVHGRRITPAEYSEEQMLSRLQLLAAG